MAQIFFANQEDPRMQQAVDQARASFRYCWRELAWERRRIIPALSLSCIKVPFADPPELTTRGQDQPQVEQMWVTDLDFDGRVIRGELLNSPHWLRSIREGDPVETPIHGISDWMYAIGEQVYGAFTVQAIRAQMSPSERAEHDDAWGLDFGNPAQALVLDAPEHPMAQNMGPSLEEFLQGDPSQANAPDDQGWTLLHHQALAGTAIGVAILLKYGADPNAVTSHGMTPAQLAASLGWTEVEQLLRRHGGH